MALPSLVDIGWGLIVVGVVLFLLETLSPGFFVAIPATILVVLGVFALVSPEPDTFWRWAPAIAVVVGIPSTLATIWIYRKMAPPTAAPVTLSADTLVGTEAVVTRAIVPRSTVGKVKIGHQIWSATAEAEIPEGTRVKIARVEGVILTVAPM